MYIVIIKISKKIHLLNRLNIPINKSRNKPTRFIRKLRDVEDTVLFKPYCIPETRNISPLFRQMQSEKIHMAIVVDEYGHFFNVVCYY